MLLCHHRLQISRVEMDDAIEKAFRDVLCSSSNVKNGVWFDKMDFRCALISLEAASLSFIFIFFFSGVFEGSCQTSFPAFMMISFSSANVADGKLEVGTHNSA